MRLQTTGHSSEGKWHGVECGGNELGHEQGGAKQFVELTAEADLSQGALKNSRGRASGTVSDPQLTAHRWVPVLSAVHQIQFKAAMKDPAIESELAVRR